MALDPQQSHQSAVISQINVTPFVDVMLVLLVIFMVTAPIIQQGVNVNLPVGRNQPLDGKEEQLVVTVTKDGTLYLNDHRMTKEELEKKLRAITELRPDRQVYFRADQNVRYGLVMSVMTSMKEAGIQRLGMVTRPSSS
jgi:biopolymer transport protein TolR